jgi:hypothetical protein
LSSGIFFASASTLTTGQSFGYTASAALGLNIIAFFNGDTSFTGFTILNSNGNFTSGKISVLGYNK